MNKIFTCVGMFLIALAIIYGLKGAMKSKKTKEGFLGGSTLTTDFFIPIIKLVEPKDTRVNFAYKLQKVTHLIVVCVQMEDVVNI